MDNSLTLFIGLRMISCAEVKSSTEIIIEPLPKSGSKVNVSIEDHQIQHPMASNHLSNIDGDELLD